jgi:anaerobic C4-dicarboxylate transporter DcuA
LDLVVALVVMAGIFPELRTVPGPEERLTLSMPIAIAIVMFAVAAIILTVTKAPVAEVPRCKTCQSGVTAIVGILGLAWLGDTFINVSWASVSCATQPTTACKACEAWKTSRSPEFR